MQISLAEGNPRTAALTVIARSPEAEPVFAVLHPLQVVLIKSCLIFIAC